MGTRAGAMKKRAWLPRLLAEGAARAREARRGTVLVIVVGALALLAVIVSAYALVGRTDASSARVVERSAQVDEVVEKAKGYFAKVIADDVFSVFLDYDETSLPVLTREAWDYPFTPPQARSFSIESGLLDPGSGEIAFNPAGGLAADAEYGGFFGSATVLNPAEHAPFGGYDPWLASTEPVFMNFENTPLTDLTRPYLDARDWLHISNFAPDGRFVNLHNLRGNFDAEPGIGSDAEGDARMSVGLTLFDEGGVSFDANEGNIPVTFSPLDFDGGNADLRNPSHWDSRQRGLFQPVSSGSSSESNPDQHEYLPYQYADADGDGFFDSRWIELVSVANPQAISDNLQARSIIPSDGRWRWFFAVRAIDLSGLVNVNTATDVTGAANGPDDDYPAGLTPADVDLRRLLTASEFYDQYADVLVNATQQEKLPKTLLDTQADYFERFQTSGGSPDMIAFDGGDEGYNVLRDAIETSTVLSNFVQPFQNEKLSEAARFEYYRDKAASFGLGVFDQGNAFILNDQSLTLNGLFGLSDLAELLTYHGRNDSGSLSRLERAVDGRGSPATSWYGPLRSNRPLLVERGLVDTLENDGLGNFFPDDDDLLLYNTDVRRLLTTVSGARPLRNFSYGSFDPTDPSQAFFLTETGGGNRGILNQLTAFAAAEPSEPPPSAVTFDARNNRPGDQKLDAWAWLARASTATGANADVQEEVGPLFSAYADALMPFASEADVWTPGSPELLTLFYGHHPLRAILASAHMTANAIDMFDNDQTVSSGTHSKGPSAYTLVLDQAFTPTPDDHPWPQLTLPDSRLPDAPMDLPAGFATGGAVNVFGVEAQPFLTEVASLTIYTDAHVGNGGDAEYDEIAQPPPLPPKFKTGPITIDGEVTDSNTDFVMQIVAFQLHNPFDEQINLSGPDLGEGDAITGEEHLYYIEFAGKFFRLVDVDFITPSELTAVTLDPGETRVFLAMSQDPTSLVTRLNTYDATITPGMVQTWLNTQFGVRKESVGGGGVSTVNPVILDRFNPDTSGPQPPPSGLAESVLDETLPENNRVARLWRKMESGMVTMESDDDLLVDRIRDVPGVTTLDRTFSGNQEIDDTEAGCDPTQQASLTCAGGPTGADNDNTGFTIALWASISRPSDPGATVPNGALPAYCIEAKHATITTGSLNESITPNEALGEAGANPDGLDLTDFMGQDPVANETFSSWFKDGLLGQKDPGGGSGPPGIENVVVETIVTEPKRKGDMLYVSNPVPSIDTQKIPTIIGPDGTLLTSYSEIYPEAHLDDEFFATTSGSDTIVRLRVADMLLPLAVGPIHDPTQPTPDEEWVTLSESLALALGYDEVTPGNSWEVPMQLVDFSSGTGLPRTDRGQLDLDSFVPFVDNNGPDGLYTPPATLPPGTGDDRVRGSGLPLALRVFDVFRATPPEWGSLSRPTYGVVNVNTAPLSVLRMLPMLSPTAQPGEWWGGTQHDEQSDIAATILAYRDRLRVRTRAPSTTLDFTESTANTGSSFPGYPGGWVDPTVTDPNDAPARAWRTEVLGVREQPGFASLGELTVVRDRRQTLGLVGYPRAHDMDRLGFDDASNLSAQGIDSILYDDPGGVSPVGDQIDDDYDEQLTIAGALTNVASVRSDIYAVWFILHGYQQSDVEGLAPSEPMTPSVARRYLMVLDRSNVQRIGDEPKILVFREVPL